MLSALLRVFIAVVISVPVMGAKLVIYHDADYTGHLESAESMAMGFNTALAEAGHNVQGYTLELVPKNHQGNVKRSLLNLKRFTKDPEALAVLGGLHSPPYIVNRNFINQNQILLMVPWAAGGPITRYSEGRNWVFRVSIDDTKAGFRIAQFAVENKECQSPHLLLENTGWGKSNVKTLTKALNAKNIKDFAVTWFEWNTQKNVARIILREIINTKADCILFVGNAIEGSVFAKAMISLPKEQRLPMISHWGITGGTFHNTYRDHLHGDLDLSFIQTCFSFISTPANKLSNQVLKSAYQLYPGKLKKPEDIVAPTGFIHAYDMGKILLAALDQIKLTGDVKKDRVALQSVLERIERPVKGLVKTYKPPFLPWTKQQEDAHEALQLNDFCMAYYDDKGVIHVFPNHQSTAMSH
ncbi:ABC transporter substrate-binding protein [Pleionea sp. CnH1-48]|uniref:ABC transporter substrate-binding protein n=1 Tax=Pleionea sp. CnH1-48 TaxID=2954494 RepID=UPI0020983476|nr:ABC transporter substrate-binding protein [Pleionea sp. CnH1-48]MCO7222690.1 ABC transporter substrate-binding protein [Pleionea sp. CnH1-48]